MQISHLYEPLIAREIESFIPRARAFRREHDARALFDAITRFAVLSYSPSQHGKHAMLAPLAAHDLRDAFAGDYDDILIECAIYAAQSRLPWSEPPITEPPSVAEDDPWSREEIRAAITAGDRLRGERWLARRMKEGDLASDFFEIATDDFADFGHKLIVAVAAWRLAELYPDHARFAILRNAVVEWTAYSEESAKTEGAADASTLLDKIIEHIDAEEGAIDAFHALALFDAGIAASAITGDPTFERRVMAYLAVVSASWPTRRTESRGSAESRGILVDRGGQRDVGGTPPPRYRLARDCGAYLKACAIKYRLKSRFPRADFDRVIAATRYNLDHGPSMEEWSFA